MRQMLISLYPWDLCSYGIYIDSLIHLSFFRLDQYVPYLIRSNMSTRQGTIDTLLSLLGSCDCCPNNKHIVTILHGSGATEKFIINGGIEDNIVTNKWNSFPASSLPIDIMTFNQLRAEASRSLKWFIHDPVPFPSPTSECFCSVPSFWLAPVDPQSLPRSCQSVLVAHGNVSTVRLQDVLPWSRMKPLKFNPGKTVNLASKAHHKALIILIIEVARSLVGRAIVINQMPIDVDTMMEAEALMDGLLDEVTNEEENEEEEDEVMDGFLGEGQRDWLDRGGIDMDETVEEDELVSSGIARAIFNDWDDVEDDLQAPLQQQHVPPHQKQAQYLQKETPLHQQKASTQQQQPPPSTLLQQQCQEQADNTDIVRGIPSSHIHPVLEQYCQDTEQNIQYLGSYLIKDTGNPLTPYKVLLSDGVKTVPALLAGHLTDLVLKGRVRVYSVIRVHLAHGHPRLGNLTLVSNFGCNLQRIALFCLLNCSTITIHSFLPFTE